MKLTTGRLIDGLPCVGIDMVIKELYLESKIDAMMREFLEQVLKMSPCFRKRFTLMLLEHQVVILEFYSPSRWKELSKDTISKILPSGDGSCRNTFKPIAGLIAKRHHIVPIRELNVVLLTLVDLSRIISKSTDRVFVFHGGQQKDLQKQKERRKR
ncbi:hypothetical protein Tco_0015497 [Tanacetum coccineum]